MLISKRFATRVLNLKAPLAAALISAMTASTAFAQSLPSDVPPALQVQGHQRLIVKALGVGVQIYTCAPSKDDPQQYAWNFTAPEATLFNSAGHRIGKHYGGPSWEANDGSKIVGTVKAHVDSPSASAIPWLLLTTKPGAPDGSMPKSGVNGASTGAGGEFARVKTVQRLHTVAGIAPSMPCDAARTGRTARVPYTADYYFYEQVR